MALDYEPGLYHVEGLQHAFQMTKTEKLMICLKVKILGTVDDSEPERKVHACLYQYERVIRMVIGDTEKDREILMARLRHAGWQGTKFEDFKLDGQIMEARCLHKAQKSDDPKYDGQIQEEWSLPLPSRPLVSDNSLSKKLNALFAKQLKSVPKPTDQPPARERPAARAPGESDPNQPPADYVSTAGNSFPDDEVPF